MIVLGYDVGRYLGWAALACDVGARPRYLEAGTVDLEDGGEDAALAAVYGHLVLYRPGAFGVERPARVFASQGGAAAVARANALLTPAWLGGRILEAARSSGALHHDVTASAARKAVVGAGKVGDSQVRAAVLARIDGWPTGAGCPDEHARDGAVVALWTARTVGCAP